MLQNTSRVIARASTARSLVQTARSAPLRTVATVPSQWKSEQSRTHALPQWAMFGALAAASVAAGVTWTSAKAEEKPSPIFRKQDVEIFAVIGPPLCGKATMCQRMARRFDMMNLGPEDDFFTEISTHLVASRGQKLRVVLNGFPKTLDEATWFEEEICPIAAIVYVDCPPEEAVKRTQKKAYNAVKGGHRLFKKETENLIAEFRHRGNFLEINGALPLEEAWEQIDAKVESALELSKRGELI